MLTGGGCDPQASDRGATRLFNVAGGDLKRRWLFSAISSIFCAASCRNESGQTLQIGRSSSGSIDFYRISAMPSRSFVLKPSFAGIVWDFVRSGAGSLGIQAAGP